MALGGAPAVQMALDHPDLGPADRLAAGDGYAIQRHPAEHRAPALVVWCREDVATPLARGEGYARAIAGAVLAVLDGCGRLPHVERPEASGRAVAGLVRTGVRSLGTVRHR